MYRDPVTKRNGGTEVSKDESTSEVPDGTMTAKSLPAVRKLNMHRASATETSAK